MSERRNYFSYSAAGSAFGGFLTHPKPLTVPTQAMASLSPSGGYGSATVEFFGIDGLLSVRKATTTAQGDLKQTELTVTLEEVNVLNRLRVKLLVMRMVSQTQQPAALDAAITPVGSLIDGLTVDGNEIRLSGCADVFGQYPTFTSLAQAYKEEKEGKKGPLQGLIIAPGTLGEPCKGGTLEECQSRAGDIRATLCPVEGWSGQLPVVNGGLRIKGFGTLYFGEFRISKFARRLTMLRVELGCDIAGSLNFGDGSGNGHWEPQD